MGAYADCWMKNFDYDRNNRNLSFIASESVPRDEAVRIMNLAIPNSYNGFKGDILLYLPRECSIILAREGSVCVYVKTDNLTFEDALMIGQLNADEVDLRDDNLLRLWWD